MHCDGSHYKVSLSQEEEEGMEEEGKETEKKEKEGKENEGKEKEGKEREGKEREGKEKEGKEKEGKEEWWYKAIRHVNLQSLKSFVQHCLEKGRRKSSTN